MTRDHDDDEAAPEVNDEAGPEVDDEAELQHRLDRTRAELTGHIPIPDQRLEAMFATGHAPVEPGTEAPGAAEAVPTDAVAEVLPIEPSAGRGSEPAPRRRIAVAAIAASFLLVVGLAAYAAAGRGGPDVPVETAAEPAGEPQPLLNDGSDEPVVDDADPDADPDAETEADNGTDRPDEPSGLDGTGEGEGGEGDHHADGLGEWLEHHREDGKGFFGFGLSGELGPLFAENQEWFECVATTVEDWISEQLESHAAGPEDKGGNKDNNEGRRRRPNFFEFGELDIEGECGEPEIAEGLVWPDFELPEDFEFPNLPEDFEVPDLEFPFFHFPDLEELEFPNLPEGLELPGFDEEFCKKTGTDDDVSIICRWPPDLDLEGEGSLRFGFGFDLGELELDLGELEETLREHFGELEETLRDRFGELEETLRDHFGELDSWFDELERHSDNEA